jgi:acid phosphatase
MKKGFAGAAWFLPILLLLLVAVLCIPIFNYLKRYDLKVLGERLNLPTRTPDRLRILALGDMAEETPLLNRMATMLETLCQQTQPEAIVFTGDNFKPHGVTSTNDFRWDRDFEKLYSGPCLSQTKFFAVLGNHDYEGNPSAQIDYTGMGSGRWTMPGRNYLVQAGALADLLFVDSNHPSLCRVRDCELDRLLKTTASSSAAWRLVFAHHPLNSTGRHRTAPLLTNIALPMLLCDGKVDALIAGHDHNLQHQIPPPKTIGCPVHEFISGGGGSPLYPVETVTGQTAFAQSSFGALSIEITPQQMNFAFYVEDSPNPVHTYQLARRKGSQ